MELRARFDTNEKELDHFESIQNQIKNMERENQELKTQYQFELERVSSQKVVIHKTYIQSGKEKKIQSLQNLIHTVKDHCKQKEKISKLWEQSSKKVFDEAREATEEQFKLKKELQKLK